MPECSRCGKQVSIWQRDLLSGLCSDCHEQDAAEEQQYRQQAAAEEAQIRKKQEAIREQEMVAEELAFRKQANAEEREARRSAEASLQEKLGQQLEKQQQEDFAVLPPCPDCAAALVQIRLFGRSMHNPLSGAAIDTDVVFFTEAEAHRSLLWGMLKEIGSVRATICTSCHRIYLHGLPLEPSL